MRAYFFTNMYLSSIQNGIQSAHALHDMFLKYANDQNSTEPGRHLWVWAKLYKTMIVLNGGYGSSLRELITIFEAPENHYPWGFFNEEPDALDGALTCVSIVLPEKIYALAEQLRKAPELGETISKSGKYLEWFYSKWEFELAKKLTEYRLAN